MASALQSPAAQEPTFRQGNYAPATQPAATALLGHCRVSGAGEFHPRALAEPDMSLSAHPAPIIAIAIRLWHDSDRPVGE